MPKRSTNIISNERKIMATSQKSSAKNCLTSIAWSADFLAKLLASLEGEEDLQIPAERCSLTWQEYCEQRSLDCSSSKTSKDCSITMVEELSKPSSPRLQNWGMTCSGKCLTAKISACPKTAKGLSLLEILEEHPDPKYFLSQKTASKLLAELNK